VDLPSAAERKAILEIHLKKRRRLLADFDLDRLAATCEGFTGAEIEQALIAALYDAFDAGRAVTDADLTAAFLATVPLSRTMAEPMEKLRAWARDKTRPASAPVETTFTTPVELPVDLPVDLPVG
jgi:SpoVK/Ycf46/Vps4 family AAA+-type ATPase